MNKREEAAESRVDEKERKCLQVLCAHLEVLYVRAPPGAPSYLKVPSPQWAPRGLGHHEASRCSFPRKRGWGCEICKEET